MTCRTNEHICWPPQLVHPRQIGRQKPQNLENSVPTNTSVSTTIGSVLSLHIPECELTGLGNMWYCGLFSCNITYESPVSVVIYWDGLATRRAAGVQDHTATKWAVVLRSGVELVHKTTIHTSNINGCMHFNVNLFSAMSQTSEVYKKNKQTECNQNWNRKLVWVMSG